MATYMTDRLNIEEVDLLPTLEIDPNAGAEYEDATQYKKVYPFKKQRSIRNPMIINPTP